MGYSVLLGVGVRAAAVGVLVAVAASGVAVLVGVDVAAATVGVLVAVGA